jgi:hypothetical protein
MAGASVPLPALLDSQAKAFWDAPVHTQGAVSIQVFAMLNG